MLDAPVEQDDDSGVEAALSAWDTSSDLLQVADPSSAPQWIDLLATRLFIVSVSKMRRPALTGEDVEAALRKYNEHRVKHEARVKGARDLMESLTASNWGSKTSGE